MGIGKIFGKIFKVLKFALPFVLPMMLPMLLPLAAPLLGSLASMAGPGVMSALSGLSGSLGSVGGLLSKLGSSTLMNFFQQATKVKDLADMASTVGQTFKNQKGRDEDLRLAQQNALQMLATQQAELMKSKSKDLNKLREDLMNDPETRRVVESFSRNPQETDALLKNYVEEVASRVQNPDQPLQMAHLTDTELMGLARERGEMGYMPPSADEIKRVVDQKAVEYRDRYADPSTYAVQNQVQPKEVPLNPVAEPLPLNYEMASAPQVREEIKVAAGNANASTLA